jgi:hypothetical protein
MVVVLEQVALGQVGIDLGLNVARLARNNSDWCGSLDLCGLTDTCWQMKMVFMIQVHSTIGCCWV